MKVEHTCRVLFLPKNYNYSHDSATMKGILPEQLPWTLLLMPQISGNLLHGLFTSLLKHIL